MSRAFYVLHVCFVFVIELEEALSDPTLDAVWLATPTDQHKNCILQVLYANSSLGNFYNECLQRNIPVATVTD